MPLRNLGARLWAGEAINVFGTASCGDLGWNVAGAADAKKPTAIRELREKEEKSSQFRSVSVDLGDHQRVRRLGHTLQRVRSGGGRPTRGRWEQSRADDLPEDDPD